MALASPGVARTLYESKTFNMQGSMALASRGVARTHTVPWNSTIMYNEGFGLIQTMELCMYNEGFGLIQCRGTLHVAIMKPLDSTVSKAFEFIIHAEFHGTV